MWRRDNKNYVTTELVCWCEFVRFASFGALFYENMLVRRLMTVFGVFIYELLRQPKATVRPIERTKRMRNDTRKERTEKHTRCIRTGDGYWFSLFCCLFFSCLHIFFVFVDCNQCIQNIWFSVSHFKLHHLLAFCSWGCSRIVSGVRCVCLCVCVPFYVI